MDDYREEMAKLFEIQSVHTHRQTHARPPWMREAGGGGDEGASYTSS